MFPFVRLLCGTRAAAMEPQDDRWWVGLPLADVVLEAPEGGLPDDNLEALLRSKDGAAADPMAIRLDLATLFHVGEFSAVQADLQPWAIVDDQGEVSEGALLTYQVWPAPKVAKVQIVGGDELKERALLDALSVTRGQVFYPSVDGPLAEQRMLRWLAREGYRQATVHVRTTEPEPGRLYVLAEVDAGTPDLLDRMTFAGDLAGVATPRELTRWARKEGMQVGRPLAPDAVHRAQDRLRENLGRVQGGLFVRSRGYISARVTPAVVRGPFEEADGTTVQGVRVTWAIEPGPRLRLQTDGIGFNGRRKAMTALGVDHRLRVTRGWLDQAPDRMEEFLQDRGFYEATARVEVERPDDRTELLRVDVDRGPKHLVGDAPDLALFVDYDVIWGEGAPVDPSERRRDERELEAVFDQSSVDVLRRDYYTDRAMETGADAARQYYADRGHLDATIEVLPPQVSTRRGFLNAVRAAAGAPARKKVRPQISVSPGPVTTLTALDLRGVAPDVHLPWLDAEVMARIDEPFSPQELDKLGQRIVEAHRAAGYLEADVRVQHTQPEPLERASTIVVDPGPKVLLRSIVTRGTRYTRPEFARRAVDQPLGEPVTSATLDDIRADLYDLGTFRNVSLDLIGDEQARDLVVSLTERARYAFEMGGGLSTDQGVRLFGRVTRRNLWGLAHRVELFGQLGLEYRSEDVRDWLPDVNDPEWRAAVSYTAPRFPLRAQDLVLDVVLRERVQERTWRMDSTGGGAAVETRLAHDHTRVRAGGRVVSRQLNQVDSAALLEGEPWSVMFLEDPTVPSQWRQQESVTTLLVEDLRDDPVAPTRGAWLSANGELAPGVHWANQPTTSFLKGEARLSGYLPLGGFTLHLGVGGGLVRSLNDGVVPLEDRFRLGGTNSLRGFVRDAVGPQNRTPRVDVDWPSGLQPVIDYVLRDDPDRWTPTGGDTTATGTLELVMPLPALGLTSWEGYSASLFADVGNVWLLDPVVATPATTDLPHWSPAMPDLRVGLGLGFHVSTPVGPLQLDLAVNPQSLWATGATWNLLVNELEEPPFRAHLTLGATW